MMSTQRQEEIQQSKILLQENRVMLKHCKTSFVVVLKLQQCTNVSIKNNLVSQLKIKKGCSAFLVLFPAWSVLLLSSDQERLDRFCCLQLYLCWFWMHFLGTVYEHCIFSICLHAFACCSWKCPTLLQSSAKWDLIIQKSFSILACMVALLLRVYSTITIQFA